MPIETEKPVESGLTNVKKPTIGSRWLPRILVLVSAYIVLFVPRLAPGTVADQRARLPPPARCLDPVEGIWKSHIYLPQWNEWTEFFLEIYHVDGSETELTGSMINHAWYGPPEAEEPPPCTGELHYRVREEARGVYEDGEIRFFGINWELEEVLCGSAAYFLYNLDNFGGTIDPEIQEFQSLVNDGGRWVNVPMVFRRISCFAPEEGPRDEVASPAYTPTRSEQRGCRCSL